MKHISAFAIATFLTIGIAFAQQQPNLHLKKGQKFAVENKVVTQSVTEVQGQTMEVNVDASTTYEVQVKDEKNNNYVLSNKISNVKMNMSQMGQEMTFDSDKEEDLNGPIGSALKEYINVPMEVEMDKTGKVIQSEKSDERQSQLAQFGDFESSGYGATLVFQALPKDLAVGKSWKKTTDDDGSVTNVTYTVKSAKGNLITLGLSGDVAIEKTIENQGMEISTKTKGTLSGEQVVDKTTNVIQSNNVTFKTDGTMEVMGQEMPTSATVTSTTSVKAI